MKAPTRLALAQFTSGTRRPEGWKSFELPAFGADSESATPPDPRHDEWDVQAPEDKSLQGWLRAAAIGVSAGFACPESFNPTLASAPSSGEMIRTMLSQQINNLLPVGVPDGTPIAHKTGSLYELRHDAGIMYGPTGPYIIVAMSSNVDSNDAPYDAIPELSRRVYNYFSSHPTSPTLYFPETTQSVGHDFLKFWFTYGAPVSGSVA